MPYHGHIDPEVEVQLDTMDSRQRNVFAAFFRYFDDKHKNLRNVLVFFGVVVALGCSLGILEVKRLQTDYHNQQCWGSYNGRVVLRALISQSTKATPSKKEQALINSSPLIKAIIKESKSGSAQFEKYAFHLLPLPECKGSNPNPVDPRLIKIVTAKL